MKPLARLRRDVSEWTDSTRRAGLHRRGEGPDDSDQDVRASDELERFRKPVKAIIIWLELHGRDADAAEVDDAMAALRETARRFDTGGLQPVFDERSDEHLSSLDLLIEAAVSCLTRNWSFPSSRVRIPGTRATHGQAS